MVLKTFGITFIIGCILISSVFSRELQTTGCSSNCLRCSSSTQCNSCSTGYYRFRYSSYRMMQTATTTNYYYCCRSPNSQCLSCDISTGNCLKCNGRSTLRNGKCYSDASNNAGSVVVAGIFFLICVGVCFLVCCRKKGGQTKRAVTGGRAHPTGYNKNYNRVQPGQVPYQNNGHTPFMGMNNQHGFNQGAPQFNQGQPGGMMNQRPQMGMVPQMGLNQRPQMGMNQGPQMGMNQMPPQMGNYNNYGRGAQLTPMNNGAPMGMN